MLQLPQRLRRQLLQERKAIDRVRLFSGDWMSGIAELKRELMALQRQLKQADRESTASAKEQAMAEHKHRFSAARLAARCTKLGLSAADYGRLVGMSGATIYLWERGESRPRPEHVSS